jgi:hypothetical protein
VKIGSKYRMVRSHRFVSLLVLVGYAAGPPWSPLDDLFKFHPRVLIGWFKMATLQRESFG